MMLLPCFGFLLLLFVVSCLVSLVAAANDEIAVNAPLAYAVSFAGCGILGYIFLLASYETNEVLLNGSIFVMAMPIIGVFGAVIGYRAGARRREHAEHQQNSSKP